MIVLLALASIGSQGTPAPNAPFHPPVPLLYVEVPDIERLRAAYGQAPMIQMARDPIVQEVFAKLQAAVGIDFVRDLEAAIERHTSARGLDGSFFDADGGFGQLRSASFSLGLAQEGSGELSRTLQQVAECVEELGAIEHALGEHRGKHGSWPETLATLALESELTTDPWSRPYAYTLEADAPRIVSLGADGKTGGAGADTDLVNGFALETWKANEVQRRRSLLIALEASSPERGYALLSPLLESDELGEARDVTIRGTRAVVQSMRTGSGEPDGWLLRWGNSLIVASQAVSFDAAVARAEGRAGSAASPSPLEWLDNIAPTSQGVDVVRIAVNPAELGLLWDDLSLVPDESFLRSLDAIVPVERAGFRMQLVEQRFVTDVVVEGTAPRWLEWFGQRPLRGLPDSLAFVPADATGVLTTQLDVTTFRSEVVRWLGLEDGEALAKLESDHGFDLGLDVLDNLAGGVTAYLMPPTTIGIPNATLALEIVDPVAFEKGVTGLLAAAAATGAEIKSSKYKSVPTWTFVPPAGGSGPVQATPTVAIVGKRALVTTSAAWMRKEIKRELEPVEGERHPLGRLESVPEDVTVLGSMDWGGTIAALYKIARSALALGGMVEVPFDTAAINAALPSTPEPFTRYLQPTTAWARRIDNGVHVRIQSSFGPETWLSLAAFGVVVNERIQRTIAEASLTPAVGADAAGPQTSGASQGDAAEAELGETRATLGFLGSRLAVYRIEHKRNPAELADLCQPTANFPRGFLDGDELPLDGWKRAFAYEVSAAGDSFRLWSTGRNGLDEKGGGDDVLLP